MNEVSTALTRVRETLVEYGWLQHFLGNERTGFCLIGAIRHTLLDSDTSNMDLYMQCIKVLHSMCVSKHSIVPQFQVATLQSWNDHHKRTEDQVLDLLDQAIRATSRSLTNN